MKSNQKCDIDSFCEMLGRLSYIELEMILDDLYEFKADQIYCDLVEVELMSRI